MALIFFILILVGVSHAQLKVGFYGKTCPEAENIVSTVVRQVAASSQKVAPVLLRLHFHDCFVQGCDGSILLENGEIGERHAFGHQGVQGFEVIERAKEEIEKVCPGIVSCADIVALAARDAVVLANGPSYEVETGRRDGVISNLTLADNMPDVSESIQILKAKFSQKGLSEKDLVVLSAAHTIGTTACFFMTERLYNFVPGGGSDPSIDPSFLPELMGACPRNGDVNARLPMDRGSGEEFDNNILQNVRSGFAVLRSDASLYEDVDTRNIVDSYFGIFSPFFGTSFEDDFANAMVKMGRIDVLTGKQGKIRSVINSGSLKRKIIQLMGPSKLRQAIGAVKDQTSISLAKVGSSASLSDLEVAIVKATRHDEYPPEERHIREILSLTSYSRAYVGACVNFLSRRLSKTKNWVVALKALMLIHRLLCDGDPSYEEEIFFATRRGTRLLNMSDFRDSRSNSWDCSAFVRSYAFYLDEHLEFRMQNRRGKRSAFAYNDDDDEEEVRHNARGIKATPLREMKNDRVFSRIHHLMQLLERFLACRPAGSAKNNRVVIAALYALVKESFQLYYDLTEITTLLFDKFIELSIPDSVKVLEIFFRINKQYEEIEQFYDWSKTVGVTRTTEYPDIDIIPPKKLERMDDLIREKSFREQSRKAMRNEPTAEHVQETKRKEPKTEPEEDMNTIKALPAPEVLPEEKTEEEEKKAKKTQDEGDLLNLGEDIPTSEEHGDQLALALFDGGQATTNPATSISPWQAFNDSGDWETALVQSASHLSNQKTSLPGGFDTLMLNGMYQQGAVSQAVACSGVVATGSASSVALGSAGRPAMLALPAPPTANGGANTAAPGTDPFAASLAIAPPAYVQMSEMEKKQRLLMEEQLMWQEYQKNGMQGQVGFANAQPNPYPYNIGGYRQTF